MLNFLTFGTILGLSAGIAPGPLLTLVISETLQHDTKSGVKVAFVPIITDLPIIILTVTILAELSNFHNILGIISLVGGFFILFLGYQSLHSKGVKLTLQERKPKPVIKGILVNALNPHPYLFWFSVGAPTMTRAMELSLIAPLAFICSFYTFLVGSKIIIAIVVGRSRSFLSGNVYTVTLRFIGLLLIILAFALFRDGLKLLGFM